jgi:predicted glutamine amidotransferase
VCRLFGMSGAPHRVRATFWLIDADDSLAVQSRREPDGTGLAWFDPEGHPRVDKQPVAAYEDRAFAREAREVESETFVAHIRYASTGGLLAQNTHPFQQHGRVFAHNGVIEGLDRLDAELGDSRSLVEGDTDSERFFALVTKRIDEHGGDVTSGLVAAARWVAAQLPLFALNVVLATPSELWALRYPDTHGLFVLRHGAAGPARHLDAASAAGTVRVRSADLASLPAVVIASEPMDADPAWRELQSGELLHVDAGLRVTSEIVLLDEPRHRLTLTDLAPNAARSQAGHPTSGDRQQ